MLRSNHLQYFLINTTISYPKTFPTFLFQVGSCLLRKPQPKNPKARALMQCQGPSGFQVKLCKVTMFLGISLQQRHFNCEMFLRTMLDSVSTNHFRFVHPKPFVHLYGLKLLFDSSLEVTCLSCREDQWSLCAKTEVYTTCHLPSVTLVWSFC